LTDRALVDDIQDSALLERVFDRWPSFHDAEILTLRLDRGPGGPSIETTIHVREMTSEVDERGYYVLRNHTLATLRFSGIDRLELADFNHQNSIDDIDISRCEAEGYKFEVEWQGSNGCDAHFVCKSIRVVSVKPYRK
jgi:hypothetical protein